MSVMAAPLAVLSWEWFHFGSTPDRHRAATVRTSSPTELSHGEPSAQNRADVASYRSPSGSYSCPPGRRSGTRRKFAWPAESMWIPEDRSWKGRAYHGTNGYLLFSIGQFALSSAVSVPGLNGE